MNGMLFVLLCCAMLLRWSLDCVETINVSEGAAIKETNIKRRSVGCVHVCVCVCVCVFLLGKLLVRPCSHRYQFSRFSGTAATGRPISTFQFNRNKSNPFNFNWISLNVHNRKNDDRIISEWFSAVASRLMGGWGWDSIGRVWHELIELRGINGSSFEMLPEEPVGAGSHTGSQCCCHDDGRRLRSPVDGWCCGRRQAALEAKGQFFFHFWKWIIIFYCFYDRYYDY